MYLVLLAFGAVLSVAGIVLAGAGLSLREGTLDASLFTPGVVAAVGGLLLIGLGLALRTLQQIERALAARAMPRVVQMPIAGAPETSDESGEAGMFAFPHQTKQASVSVAVAADASDEEPAQAVAQKAPDSARIGNRSYPPPTKPAGPASGEANNETDVGRFGRRGNGAAATRIAPRPPISARSTAATERSKPQGLDTMWLKGSRPVRGTQTEPAQNSEFPVMETQLETRQVAESTSVGPLATAYDEPVPISVLRSGVVDGMAYTLYSDGSIEAQLPQGTLRFGSITELRQHLEQGV
jgi:hypothetical protein